MTKEQFQDKLREIKAYYDKIEDIKNEIFEAFFDNPENEDDWDELSMIIKSLMPGECGCLSATVQEIVSRYDNLPFSDK